MFIMAKKKPNTDIILPMFGLKIFLPYLLTNGAKRDILYTKDWVTASTPISLVGLV